MIRGGGCYVRGARRQETRLYAALDAPLPVLGHRQSGRDTGAAQVDAIQHAGFARVRTWHASGNGRRRTLGLAPAYRPRRPTETVLYAVVRDWLETFLAHARETYEAPLPRYL